MLPDPPQYYKCQHCGYKKAMLSLMSEDDFGDWYLKIYYRKKTKLIRVH